MEKHNNFYYEFDRNMDSTKNINPKMKMSKEELGLKDDRIPDYYRGRNGYEARKVCDNFDLTYHLATATTYILRAYHKHDTPVDCLKKAIAHLEFELEKIDDQKSKRKIMHSDKKEALEMIMSKMARIINGDPNYKDSWTDIIGYAKLIEKDL